MTVMHSLYREPGTVTVDEGSCDHCGSCVRICPADVLATDDGGRVVVREDSPFGCIACGHCMMVCPGGSITVSGRGISKDDLLPLPRREERATADALEALMQGRRSIRRFAEREVDPDDLDRIVRMASAAPMGVPPWDVGCAVVRGREEVGNLAGEVARGYAGFLKVVRPWVLKLLRPFIKRATFEMFHDFILPLGRTYVAKHRAGRDAVFWGAPALLVFHHSPYAEATDAMIACTYAMLAAESLGLGTTMIGGAPPMLQRRRDVCARLGLPAGNTPAIVLIVGHPAAHFRRAIRRHFTS